MQRSYCFFQHQQFSFRRAFRPGFGRLLNEHFRHRNPRHVADSLSATILLGTARKLKGFRRRPGPAIAPLGPVPKDSQTGKARLRNEAWPHSAGDPPRLVSLSLALRGNTSRDYIPGLYRASNICPRLSGIVSPTPNHWGIYGIHTVYSGLSSGHISHSSLWGVIVAWG